MSRVLRSVLAAAVVMASASFMTEPVGRRASPGAGARAGASTTPAEAEPFVGDWAVTVGMNAFEVDLCRVGEGRRRQGRGDRQVRGQPTIDVSDISLSGKNLVLKHVSDHGRQPDSNRPDVSAEAADHRADARGASEGFMLPAGYRMELVAAEPDVISPTLIEFDGNGRMYVGEMISYMMDADGQPRARADQPDHPVGEHEGRRPLRQAHRVRRQARRAAHDPAAPGRRHPHQRDRLRRSGEAGPTPTTTASPTSARSCSPASARAATPTSSTRRRACSGTWTTGSTPPTTRSGSAGRRPASCASRPGRTAASGA